MIEHNLDIIKSADWIIDLGPEGGSAGGRIVATGTPEQVARNSHSFTGKFLARALQTLTQITIRRAEFRRADANEAHEFAGTHFAARWLRVGLTGRLARRRRDSRLPRSRSANPREAAATSAPQEKEDPLAPLLQQANDAIDKMDFAAALDPLQKYIAQRPDDPYAHFQLGYAYAGLKRPEDAKSGIFARDRAGSEDGGRAPESWPGADG